MYRLATLSRYFCTYAEWKGKVMALTSSLILGEEMHLSQMNSNKGKPSLPIYPKGCSDATICSWAIFLSSPQEHCNTLRAPYQPHHGPLKLQSVRLADLKKAHEDQLPLYPFNGFGEVFSLWDPLCPSLFLSCLSSWPGFPPLGSICYLLLPQITSPHPLPSILWLLLS